jgi:RNA polymerase sigma-70 factor (ECF subfamily)
LALLLLTESRRASRTRPDYHPFHAARGDLLCRLGRNREAAAAYQRAATLAPTDAERDFLRLGGRALR